MSTTENNLKSEFSAFISQIPGIENSSVLICFSGGADSAALVSLFKEFSREHPVSLGLAYMEHGIRPDGEREAEHSLVKETSRALDIPLYEKLIPRGEIEKKAAGESRSLEELAREMRYSFFYEVMTSGCFSYLALGHHFDDQAETLIMRFFQGSGVSGLSGIPGRRDRILRPLIFTEKQTILSYLEMNKIRYINDSTNAHNDYLRNQIRNILIPHIKEIFPGYKTGLNQFQRKMESLADFIQNEKMSRILWKQEGRFYITDAGNFYSQPAILQQESLFDLYNRTIPGITRVPHRFIGSLKQPVEGIYRQTLLRGKGILLEKRGERLFWTMDIVFPGKNSYLIEVKKPMELKISGVGFEIKEDNRNPVQENCLMIDRENLIPPFILRSRESGDFIELPGGGKTIKKLYNSWHIPESDRWKIPVLEDRSGIIGVIGSPWGGRNCLRKQNTVKEKSGSRICWFITWSEGSV